MQHNMGSGFFRLFIIALAPIALVACNHTSVEKCKVRYWTTGSTTGQRFPEQQVESIRLDLDNKSNLGVCFSGGGTRSAAATAGELRALNELNILKNVRYISAVSGGSWAATPYTFLQKGSDETFFGKYISPETLTETDLETKEGSMLRAISDALVVGDNFRNMAIGRGSESYSRVISKTLLKPFGLSDPESWFTWNQHTADDAKLRNPFLTNSTCYMAAAGRPYLIVGGTIRYYSLPSSIIPLRWSTDPDKRVPVEFTPLYSGVGPLVNSNKYNSEIIGGGYVESFAFDSIYPKKEAEGVANVHLYSRLPWRNDSLLSLGDVVGSSGAAPGEFSLFVELLGFPKFQQWSAARLDEMGDATAKRYKIEDGGLSENLGIMPLLSRRVDHIIAFVNAQSPARLGKDNYFVPDYINALFGREDKDAHEGCQVFPTDALDDIANQVATNVKRGKPAVAVTSLKTKENPRYGVSSYNVKVFWVFLEAKLEGEKVSAAQNWLATMPSNSPVKRLIENERMYKRFPCYRTFFEDRPFPLWDVIRLKEEKASALAHYTSWAVMNQKEEIQNFLKASKSIDVSIR